MIDLCKLMWCAFAGLFRSRAALEAELLVLRHQLNVLCCKSPGRLAFSSIDRLVFADMYALAPNIRDALKIVNGTVPLGIVLALGQLGWKSQHGSGAAWTQTFSEWVSIRAESNLDLDQLFIAVCSRKNSARRRSESSARNRSQ